MIGSGVIGGVAFVYAGWTVYGAGAQTVLFGFHLLLLGLPAYVWMRKQQACEDRVKRGGVSTDQPVALHEE